MSAGEGFAYMTELHSGREPAAWEHGVGDSLDWRKALDCSPCPSPVPPNSGHHWSCLGWEGGDAASGFLSQDEDPRYVDSFAPSSNASRLAPLVA